MKNNPIEDISIDKSYNSKKNKKGKGLIVVILFLFVVLLVVAGFYWYILNNSKLETNKELFLKNISNNNTRYFLENELYEEIINKLKDSNSEVTSNIKFNTTISNELLDKFDISKFVVNMNSYNDVKNTKFYNELNLSYLDNNLIKLKIINNKNQVAVASDEIVNKFVGMNYENMPNMLNKILNTNVSLDQIDGINISDLSNEEKISIDNSKMLKKYYDYIINEISEEKFSKENNFVITRNTNNIQVTSYTLNLTQEELNELTKKILTTVRDDTDFLEKIVTNKVESSREQELEPETDSTINLNPIGTSESNLNNDENIVEVRIPSVINSNDINAENMQNEEQNVEQNITLDSSETENNIQETIEENNNDEILDDNEFETNKTDSVSLDEILFHLLIGKKIDTTVEELQKSINKMINELDNQNGNGLSITLYVSDKQTEKISIILPNSSNVEIEFNSESENENSIKFTLLEKNEDNKSNGYSIEISKIKKDAVTTINGVYSFIEGNEINRKLSLNINTEGTVYSKNYKNDVLVNYSDKNGEISVTIDNNIKLNSSFEIPDLGDDNCLFIDTLDDQTLQATIDAIIEKSMIVYEEKMNNLNMIDTNTRNSVVEQPEKNSDMSKKSRDEVKEKLITTISDMMREKLDNNSNLKISDLDGLQIEGYEVKTIITSNLAIITIDGYTFHIDSDFNLSDAE